MSIKLAIIGLGTIGQRILVAAQRHPDVEVVAVFDATPISLEALSLDEAQRSKISVESSAQALMERSDVDVVYIGTPPNSHMQYCHMALDNNKAIWCEKPLAVNVAESKAFIARLKQTSVKAAVNLSLASSPVVAEIAAQLESMNKQQITSIEFQFHYSAWPRRWQSNASNWLCLREQGGFLREVYSHFVFLHQRLIGELELIDAKVEYTREGYAETLVQANYRSQGIDVRLQGVVGGNGPDTNNWIVYGEHKSIHFTGFRALKISEDDCWKDVDIDLAGDLDYTQLAQVVKMLRNEPHSLASFEEALQVQEVVEGLLSKG
ncbi:MAG: Gfo/Idh/MocA family oxidoreductase [Oceanospirillaceae bacterium]